jgi:hypothetical protein
MAYIGRDIRTGAFRQLDDISSGFDGSDTTHTMQVNSTNVSVGDVNQILLSLGGVIQKPGTDFTVSGSTLTFTTAPAANTSFFAILLGSDNGGTVTPTDGSVTTAKILDDAVTGAKLADDIAITTTGDISFDGGSFVFNESSADKDFRIESNGNTHAIFVDAGNDRVAINNSSPTRTFSIGGDGIAALEGSSNALTFYDSSTLRGYITTQSFGDHDGDGIAILTATGEPIKFFTNGGERIRIRSDGDVLIATTDQYAYDNTSDQAITFNTIGLGSFARSQGAALVANRMTNDGNVISIYAQGAVEGNISVSGSIVTYGQFTGVHWSRLADNSKPTILRGTIIESLDEMCDWYAVEFEVETTEKDSEGNSVTKKTAKRQAYALKDGESVGDTITYRYLDGNDYSAKIIKEGDVKHTKCKVSDTADSKKVYGLFHRWDDADDGSDGDVNDLEVAQVGTYIIRVNKDVTVEAGDLLVSNGDGTAKKQDDDIIRSKTVAKVNSNVKVETYSDGSYTVPCTLHC